MYTLKQARAYAANLAVFHREPWSVIQTHPDAAINKYPGNAMNRGTFIACKASELSEYIAGGCVHIETIYPVKGSK